MTLPQVEVRGQFGSIFSEAFTAFNAGDYETAAVEFDYVFKQFRSVERDREISDALNARSLAGGGGGGIGDPNAAATIIDLGGQTAFSGGSGNFSSIGPAFTLSSESAFGRTGTVGVRGKDSLNGRIMVSPLSVSTLTRPSATRSRRVATARDLRSNRALKRIDNAFPLHMKGLSLLQLGEMESAESSFRRALRYDRGLFDARYRLALMAVAEGDVDEATAQKNKLIRLRDRCERRICANVDMLDKSLSVLNMTLAPDSDTAG